MSEATLPESHDGAIYASRRILSIVQVVVGYCQASTYCFVQCTFYPHGRNFRKSRKGGPTVPALSGSA